MPTAVVGGAHINYEVLGTEGPWVALSPGGRRGLDAVRYLAERLSTSGFRVLLHDRRNCGASDVLLGGDAAEYEIWADDLYELLQQVGAAPAFVGGSSSGCRLAILTHLRHPDAVRGLLLWRVTGGRFAANRLAQNYYGQFVEAARQGGMAAVCATEHFQDLIRANPVNRERIMAMDPDAFISSFERWGKGFRDSAELPIIGASEDELRAISVPTCIVPGSDQTHPRAVGENAAKLIPGSELHVLLKVDHPDMELGPAGEFEDLADEHTKVYVEFMNSHAAVSARGST